MQDVSSFGFRVRLVASKTFPQGITITQFADDADPFDAPAINVNDSGMSINGDLVIWSRAVPLGVTFNVIPGGPDDQNLAILFEANRAGRNKFPAQDVITVTAIYPDQRQDTYSNGAIISGMPGRPIASSGRQKAKPYTFTFENKTSS